MKGCKEHHGHNEATDLFSYLFKETERCFLGEILTYMDKIAKSYERQAENSLIFILISNSFEDMDCAENALSRITLVDLYAVNYCKRKNRIFLSFSSNKDHKGTRSKVFYLF